MEIAYYSKIFTVSFFYSFFYWPIYMHYFNISKQTKSFFHPKISIKSNMHQARPTYSILYLIIVFGRGFWSYWLPGYIYTLTIEYSIKLLVEWYYLYIIRWIFQGNLCSVNSFSIVFHKHIYLTFIHVNQFWNVIQLKYV